MVAGTVSDPEELDELDDCGRFDRSAGG